MTVPMWAFTPEVTHNDRRRAHSLLPPAEALAKVPALYATERAKAPDKVVHIHLFVGSCDWWLVELDPAEGLAFGYACLGDPANAEWGYVSLAELAALRLGVKVVMRSELGDNWSPAAHGLPMVVERDLYWEPRQVRDVAEMVELGAVR